jgi:hypothetical protein
MRSGGGIDTSGVPWIFDTHVLRLTKTCTQIQREVFDELSIQMVDCPSCLGGIADTITLFQKKPKYARMFALLPRVRRSSFNGIPRLSSLDRISHLLTRNKRVHIDYRYAWTQTFDLCEDWMWLVYQIGQKFQKEKPRPETFLSGHGPAVDHSGMTFDQRAAMKSLVSCGVVLRYSITAEVTLGLGWTDFAILQVWCSPIA